MSHNTAHLTAEQRALYKLLLSVRDQQYGTLVETERALQELNPRYTRRFLTRQERRELRRQVVSER